MAALVVGCNKDGLDDGADKSALADNQRRLNIHSNVQGCSEVEVKSTSMMVKDSQIGIFVCDHCDNADSNPYASYGLGLNNVSATVASVTGTKQKWNFVFPTSAGTYSDFILTAKEDEEENPVNADVFAYYPYSAGISNLECIPFKAGLSYNTYGIMYAEENIGNSANKNIDPREKDAEGNAKDADITFTFHHLLSLMSIKITMVNPRYNHPDSEGGTSMSNVSAVLTKKAGHLYSSGVADAVHGRIYDLKESGNTMTVYGSGVETTLLVPTQEGEDYQDNDYELTFSIDKISFKAKFPILREHLKHSDGSYGFKAGYKYQFKFVYDNFLRFDGITIEKWDTDENEIFLNGNIIEI